MLGGILDFRATKDWYNPFKEHIHSSPARRTVGNGDVMIFDSARVQSLKPDARTSIQPKVNANGKPRIATNTCIRVGVLADSWRFSIETGANILGTKDTWGFETTDSLAASIKIFESNWLDNRGYT